MNKLSIKEMKDIIANNSINKCTENERQQIFEFAFGAKYMQSNDKGKKVKYKI